jgi:hypothetical protein
LLTPRECQMSKRSDFLVRRFLEPAAVPRDAER